ncbi:beta-N-acetylhexosaminidase [Pedobacter nyackensis]|uniref:beta-N-acetylhexosaminidase n=1 Tax=Pedobacter nyackensis TaxID=475255 RepID=UPI00292CB7E2|nr:beta-N-acetylhexosaminidase [Pedobacter nyackensis]
MGKILFFLSVSILSIASAQEKSAWLAPHTLKQLASAPTALIPFPQKAKWNNGAFRLQQNITILYQANDSLKNSAIALQDVLQQAGIKSNISAIKKGIPHKPGSIVLKKDAGLNIQKEGYHLKISNSGIEINGKDAAGVFYAVQTIRQLIQQDKRTVSLPTCEIEDWPAFSLRGFMHDTGRNFQEINSLKQQLDRLAAYKFNTFHWHLTDNPAWRPESKIFPQLNDPKFRKAGRNPDKSYSFDEIREIINYAAVRHIKVIPELDMPGHSAYFEPTFGFKMGSPQGMDVLEKLIDEFCAEIPVKDCPIIHIGSDEVHIDEPKLFITRMSARLKKNGRQPMVWNPGLKAEKGTIEQLWRDEETNDFQNITNPYVDSYAGYLNSSDALTLIRRYFFQQPCNREQSDSLALGGILCCWPDTRVEDKSKIFEHNPVWPGMITYSEALWCGRPQYEPVYMAKLPASGSDAWKHFNEFEKRLANHRDRFFKQDPFPFAAFSNVEWKIEGQGNITGGVLNFDDLINSGQLKAPENDTINLSTYLYSDREKEIYAWVGFETAARSTRKSAGLPEQGKWDANGGYIQLNDKNLPGPTWSAPGQYRYLEHTWFSPPNEIPFTDEEFYWSRKPVKISLKKGWNKLKVHSKRSYKEQDWMFAFVPVKLNNEHKWVEDLSIFIKSTM